MGKIQQLRRSVRADLVGYAKRHPESFKAHMVASATLWLLAGRPGLTTSDQLKLVIQAHAYVTDLISDHPDSSTLAAVKGRMDDLLAELSIRCESVQAEEKFLAEHGADFTAWAEQLAESEDGQQPSPSSGP